MHPISDQMPLVWTRNHGNQAAAVDVVIPRFCLIQFAPVQYVVRHKCTVDESMEHDITNITTNTSAKMSLDDYTGGDLLATYENIA